MTIRILIAAAVIVFGLLSYLLGAIYGTKLGIRMAVHDVLVLEDMVKGDPVYDTEMLAYLREQIAQAKAARPVDVKAEWQKEQARLHDAGIT